MPRVKKAGTSSSSRSESISNYVQKLNQSTRSRSRVRDSEKSGSGSESSQERHRSSSSGGRQKKKGLSVRNPNQVVEEREGEAGMKTKKVEKKRVSNWVLYNVLI